MIVKSQQNRIELVTKPGENKAKIKSDPDPVYDADTDVDEDEEKGTKASPTKSGEDKRGADVSLKGRRVLLYGVFNDRCAHYLHVMTIL